MHLVIVKNTERAKPKRDRRRVTVGKLRLTPLEEAPGILAWSPPGQEYPMLHVLDGGGFLYTSRNQRHNNMLTNVDWRNDEETADALLAAIMRSRTKAVVAFREEWLK